MARNVVVANVRRWVGVSLLVALAAPLLTSCSNAAKMSTVVGLDESIAALAGGGVAVMDDVSSRTPLVGLTGTPSAMRFTSWQVRNLVAEANAHGGYLGSDLDALVAPPAGSPGLSVIVGAWLTRNDGALATTRGVSWAIRTTSSRRRSCFPPSSCSRSWRISRA